MQQLQVIEHDAKRVLTTSQLADSFDTNNKILTRNFQRNQERYQLGSHYYVLAGDELRAFKAGRPEDANLKYVSVLYLWTEQGAWMHAKSLNTDRAWDAYRLLIDNYYSLAERVRGMQADDNMTPALIPPHIVKVFNQFESRLIVLEKQLQNATLHSGEQRRLRNAVGERVYQLSKREAGARPVMFRAIYSEIRERYEVDSYRDIKQSQLQDALTFVSSWGGVSSESINQ